MAKASKHNPRHARSKEALPSEIQAQDARTKQIIANVRTREKDAAPRWRRRLEAANAEAAERAAALKNIQRLMAIESGLMPPPWRNPPATMPASKEWVEQEVNRMREAGEIPDALSRLGLAKKLEPRMREAVRNGHILRALKVKSLDNMLRDLDIS